MSSQKLLEDPNLDKVDEYFRAKDSARTLRNDLKDYKAQMPEVEELEKLMKKVKELREKIKEDETVRELTEKIQTTKERQDLLKELIRIDLLESGLEEVKHNGRKLRIINTIKELRDEGDDKKRPEAKSIFRN